MSAGSSPRSVDNFVHLHVHTEYSMLDGASLPRRAVHPHQRARHAGDRDDRPRQPATAPTTSTARPSSTASSRSSGSRPTSPPAPRAASGAGVRWGQGDLAEEGGNDVAGGGAYTHMTMWAESTEGMHNLFRLSTRSSLEGYFFKPRMDKELLAEHGKGLIVTTGCPSGAIQTRLRLGQYDEALREARRAPGHLRQRQLLPRADGPRHRHREAGPRRPAPPRQGAGPPADRHQRLPLQQPRGRRGPRRPASASRPGKRLADTNRLKFDGGGYYIKSRRRDARAVGRRVRPAARPATTPCDRRALRGRVHRVQRRLHAAFRRAGRRDRGLLAASRRSWRGIEAPLPRRASPTRRSATGPTMELGDHLPDGLPRLLPRGRRLHQLGQGQRHPGRPGPRFGRGLDRRLRPAASPTSTRSSTA